MGISPFASRFLEIAKQETRSIAVVQKADLPVGHYGFVELYCDELDCDCRRVVIHVLTEATGPKVWATINYGWEDEAYYATWMGDSDFTPEFAGASLDPLNRQSKYADVLLDYFVNVVADEAYIERLKRHYAMFKSSLKSGSQPQLSQWKPPRKMKRRLR